MSNKGVDLKTARALCVEIESISPLYGCHVALTGGCLYKEGPRKDVDIVLYRDREKDKIDFDGLFKALESIGITQGKDHNFCKKAIYCFEGEEYDIDFLCPEDRNGNYVEDVKKDKEENPFFPRHLQSRDY